MVSVASPVLGFAAGRDFGAFCLEVRREVLKADSRTVEPCVRETIDTRDQQHEMVAGATISCC